MKAWLKSCNFKSLMLEIPAVLGFAGVTLAGLLDIGPSPQRTPAMILLACFGLVFFLTPPKNKRPIITHIRLGVLTLLVSGLLLIWPRWGAFPILFFLLGPQAMTDLPLKAGLAWIGAFTVVTAIIFTVANAATGLVWLLAYAGGYVFFAIFGWTMMQAEQDRKRSEQLLAELQQAHQQLQSYAARVEELTIAQERNRIAREMHDALGHRLTVAAVQLEGAQRLIPTHPERASQIITTVREQVKEGLSELRRTVAMLRASVEEDLPLPDALSKLADQMQQATGLQIHLSIEDCPPTLPLPQRQALYRAAQESLTNIQRHAEASEAWLQLTRQEGQIVLLISDNGIGMTNETSKAGFGLIGLKERSAALGGEFFIDARPGGGTQVTFRIPLPEETYA